MSRKITFDELVARREQRENDKLKVGMLTIPGTGVGLEARMPPQKAVLELYGELGGAKDSLRRCAAATTPCMCAVPSCRTGPCRGLGVDENPMAFWMSCSRRWSRTSWAAMPCGSWDCCCRCRNKTSLPAPMGSRPRTRGLRR